MDNPLHCEREVVIGDDFAAFLQPLIDQMQKTLTNPEDERTTGLGALEIISGRSGVPQRTIYRILKGESESVDLDIADRILLALGRYVEIELADSIITQYEATVATRIQLEMMEHWCRDRGLLMPPVGSKERRVFPGKVRRMARAEEQQRRGVAA